MKNNKLFKYIIEAFIILTVGIVSTKSSDLIIKQFSVSEGWYNTTIIVFLAFLLIIFQIFWKDKIESKCETTNRASLIVDKQILLDNLKEQYTDRLNGKMRNHLNFNIDLKLNYTTEGTSENSVNENFLIKTKNKSYAFEKAYNHYENKIRRLLIIGEPGTGKSILLLKFALKLIEKSFEEKDHPIPLIVELSTWNDEYNSIEDWLEPAIKNSNTTFTISRSRIKELIDRNELILLFDGFDEIKQNFRDSFLEKMTVFLNQIRNNRENFYPETIITSRVDEYMISEDAPVFATLKIENITKKEIKNIINERIKYGDPRTEKLKVKMKEFPILYKIGNSAFFLHILLSIDLNFIDTKVYNRKELAHKILERYINLNLSYLQNTKQINSITCLSWLAFQVQKYNNTKNFELTDLQHSWISNNFLYYLIRSVLIAITFLSISLSFMFFIFDIMTSIIVSLMISISAALIYLVFTKILIWLFKLTMKKSNYFMVLLNDQFKIMLSIHFSEKFSFRFKNFDKKNI